jgi:hypothetical protein
MGPQDRTPVAKTVESRIRSIDLIRGAAMARTSAFLYGRRHAGLSRYLLRRRDIRRRTSARRIVEMGRMHFKVMRNAPFQVRR